MPKRSIILSFVFAFFCLPISARGEEEVVKRIADGVYGRKFETAFVSNW